MDENIRRLEEKIAYLARFPDSEITFGLADFSLVVLTPTAARLYAAPLHRALAQRNDRVSLRVMHCSEQQKSLAEAEALCRAAVDEGLDRSALLLSVGGGVCSDIVTMAASWIRRGIGHVRVPTTLVAQVDRANRLYRGRKTRAFKDVKYSDIVKQVATEAGLDLDPAEFLDEASAWSTSAGPTASAGTRSRTRATHSRSCSMINSRSTRSFSVSAGSEILVSGRLMPFFEDSRPPSVTSTCTS